MATAGMDTCIVFAAAIPWDGPRHRQQEVAARLAERYLVIYLEPPSDRLRLGRRGCEAAVRALEVSVEGRVIRVRPGLSRLPGARLSAAVNAVNRGQVAKQVNALPQLRACAKRILWLDESAAWVYAGRFRESLVVYDCVDEDWTYARNPFTRRFLLACEEKVTRAADIVFTSSRTLHERKRPVNPDTYWMPNAVDYDHFSRAAGRQTGPQDGPGARLCVMGHTMPQRTDLAMLGEMARLRPGWRVVFIGKTEWPADRAVPPSFEFLGERPYEELPELLSPVDVCLIPYRMDGDLDYIHPKKLYEYLAAGKPVVATDLPELRAFAPVVKIARSAEELVARAEECLRENADPVLSTALVRQRQAIARENTWDRRVSQMVGILESRLGGS
jgi:glycosyltransferase involved in cell wall biosynthesis